MLLCKERLIEYLAQDSNVEELKGLLRRRGVTIVRAVLLRKIKCVEQVVHSGRVTYGEGEARTNRASTVPALSLAHEFLVSQDIEALLVHRSSCRKQEQSRLREKQNDRVENG